MRADDGIRTRDPHLGKSILAALRSGKFYKLPGDAVHLNLRGPHRTGKSASVVARLWHDEPLKMPMRPQTANRRVPRRQARLASGDLYELTIQRDIVRSPQLRAPVPPRF